MSHKNFTHVAFEGIDGSGKTHQLRLLESALKSRGRSVLTCAEPSPQTELGRMIRDQFMERTLDDAEMRVLFAAERIINRRIWMPRAVEALCGEDTLILSDRSVLSALAYHGLNEPWLDTLCPQSTFPDYALIIDVPPEQALERVAQRKGEVFDRWETLERLKRARDNYLTLGQTPLAVIVDGTGNEAAVFSRVLDVVDGWGV